jgi:hypothetical protein
MRHPLLWLCLAATLALSPAWAGTCLLIGSGGLALQLTSTALLMKTPQGALVQGRITVTPAEALEHGLSSTYYLDDRPVGLDTTTRPELIVDTAKLGDGLHTVRLEAGDGVRLAMSTGNLALHVANDATTNVILGQRGGDGAPAFVKLYRKIVLREIVWFDNREADLEKHGFISGQRIYITLTDLMRHVGGTMVWGPSQSYITVERSGIKVRVIPGSARVYVNGEKQSLGRVATRIDSRTFVPIRPMLSIFGIDVDWNRAQHRAFVNLK